ncbi:hypothetical protein JCM14469_14500 [Desulfatiferula olefinivorans]
MDNFRIILLLILLSVGLCGCPFFWNHDTKTLAWNPQSEPLASDIEDARNRYNLDRLERGMDREEIYRIMGMPDLYGRDVTRDEADMDIFFYYTRTRIDDGYATAEECTPLILKNGRLEDWGDAAYARYKSALAP